MKRIISRLFKLLMPFFNTRAAGMYILLFALAIGVATFIENDFGTSAAQKVIFQAWWFELLLLLFGISIVVNIIQFRMVQQKKWSLLLFHSSIIIILIGAGLTRYMGFEGVMHIRENSSSNRFLSSNTFLSFEAKSEGQTYQIAEEVLFASLGKNRWQESYLFGNELVEVELKSFIPNPKPSLVAIPDGKPMLKIVIAGAQGREEYFLEEGQRKRLGKQVFNFTPLPMVGAINLRFQNDSLLIRTEKILSQTVMATQQRDTLYPSSAYQPLALRALYSDGQNNFVFAEFQPSGQAEVISEDPKVKGESICALELEVKVRGEIRKTYVYGRKGSPGRPQKFQMGDLELSIAYGASEVKLPFSIRLYDFELEKYPGTNSAASYASEVQLIDERKGLREDHRIYMNHILDYDGYRFFQSSFDKDEKGTYLSVNSDLWGTLVSYLGYALLTLGMLLTLISKKTRFFQVQQRIQKLRTQNATFVLLLGFSLAGSFLYGKSDSPDLDRTIEARHAQQFSRLIVQDYRGRMKPLHTMSREILRKVYRKESFEGMNADQVLLSMFAYPKGWFEEPVIKLGKHQDIQEKLGVSGKYAAYADFFSPDGRYKLREEMRRVHSLAPIDRGVYEKELLKIDERLNILGMVFSGNILKIIPVPDDPNNTWASAQAHGNHEGHRHGPSVAEKFFPAYRKSLQESLLSRDFGHAGHLLDELEAYQQKHGQGIIPSSAQVKGEIMLNNSRVFTRLAGLYGMLGLAFLFFQFLSVFKPDLNLKKVYWGLFSLVGLGFLLHTAGLAMRWYVSERAPWSNGYESMIYIAWTTTLAGVLFTRKSFGGLAATMVLAATILLVSTLSFLDPEITPLVPVLKSYWLTIHVSMEAGSYGFLMLGAIIGLINLIMMTLMQESNKERVRRIIQEMSYISELTLTSGLFMVSVGTFLGGIWANESWGRYWGWDAKETWALVTILVYAFILHMRIIPKLFGLFSYNFASIFGLASVIMTYYGVNYYLSGLHSYATGDPVPIPSWVYIMVGAVTVIASIAYMKKRKYAGYL